MGYRGAKFANIFHDLERWSEKVSREYAEAGGAVMTERAKAHSPVGLTGELRASWYVRKLERTVSLGFPAYESGAATDVEYAPYVNYGTGLWGPKHAKYPIRPKDPDGWLHWKGADGKDVFAKLVMHPGSPPQNIIPKAIMDTFAEAEVFGGAVLDARIEELRLRWDAEAARARADVARP